jgi:hypothetical protein
MIPIEISRILKGSLNRGRLGSYYLYPNYNKVRNQALANTFIFDSESLAEKGIVPFDATSATNINNFPIQDKYLWPWSHAALLFCLVVNKEFSIIVN